MKILQVLRVFTSFILLAFSFLIISTVVVAKTDRIPPGLTKNVDKIDLEARGNKVKVTASVDDEEESGDNEVESEEVDELVLDLSDNNEDENELDEEDGEDDNEEVRVRANNNATYVIQNKLQAKTNFPLKVNYETRELIVSTPKGEKVVTVLPEAAIQNMLAANVLDQLGGKGGYYWDLAQPSPSVSPTPDTGSTLPGASVSPSPTPQATQAGGQASVSPSPVPVEEDTAITLTLDEDGNLVYEITGAKTEQFLGLFNVKLKRVAVVSAESGEVIEVKQKFITKVLDSLSF